MARPRQGRRALQGGGKVNGQMDMMLLMNQGFEAKIEPKKLRAMVRRLEGSNACGYIFRHRNRIPNLRAGKEAGGSLKGREQRRGEGGIRASRERGLWHRMYTPTSNTANPIHLKDNRTTREMGERSRRPCGRGSYMRRSDKRIRKEWAKCKIGQPQPTPCGCGAPGRWAPPSRRAHVPYGHGSIPCRPLRG